MTVRRLAIWVGGGMLLAVVAWSVLQPTTVSTLGLGRVMAETVVVNRPTPTVYSIEGDGPPLGEPHGWFVVASDGHELVRIDLADGAVDGYRLEGYPQTVIGDTGAELVMAGPAPQPVYAVSIHDPAGPQRELFRWPIDARDPVNNAYYQVQRIDEGTVRIGHVRQDNLDLVRAVVDIDLASGRRRMAPTEAVAGDSPDRWLSQWIGNPTASTDDGHIIVAPASEIGRRAVLLRLRDGDGFHDPVSIPLRFRPKMVTLVPKAVPEQTKSETNTTMPAAPAPPPPSTTTNEPSPIRPEPVVPLEVLQELDLAGYDYLIAGNHRSFHRVELATGDVDRFDLGVRVVAVSAASDGERELFAIEPGSAVIAVSARQPANPGREVLSLRRRQGGVDRPMTVRFESDAGGDDEPVIEYWDVLNTSTGWRRLDLDLAPQTDSVGGYRLEPSNQGVVVVAVDGGQRYLLPLDLAGGASSVLLV